MSFEAGGKGDYLISKDLKRTEIILVFDMEEILKP